jgi:hypothetical protein
MPQFVWIALAVNLVCLVSGAIWLTVNALRAWRRGWPVVRSISVAADDLPPKIADLEARVNALEPRVADLQQSTASLSASVARARLLLDAALQARGTIAFARAILRFR